jgi:Lon-like protease
MTTNSETLPPSLPSDTPEPGAAGGSARPLARYWIALAITGGLVAMVVTVAGFVRIDYFGYRPGHSFDTAALVSVGGGQPTYPPEGQVLFLTVGIARETLLSAARDWADRDVDLVALQGHLQGRSEDENRSAQAAAMSASEKEAIAVALDRLGIPRTPTGTGAVITSVGPGTPAEGILQVADVIVGVDGQPIGTTEQLGEAIGVHGPGETVTLEIEDFATSEHREATAVLAARPDDPARGFLGVGTQTRDFDPGSPFPVSIDSGRVGGPSAGLAFTLAIIDVLTPGELTGGRRISVTGTIDLDGTVGVVGGVAQKSAAASDSGAEVMIVPTGEEETAQRLGYDLEIIGVADLDEALAALESIGGDPLPPTPIG